MDRLTERYNQSLKALATLQEVLRMETGPVVRDAAIQRFELTFESVWKTARLFLLTWEGVDVASPKGVIRACHSAGLLTEGDARRAMDMADDRNLASHTYDEALSNQIFGRLPGHARLLEAWLQPLGSKTGLVNSDEVISDE